MNHQSPNPLVIKAKILVTDDDPDIQKITHLNLHQEGFEVLQAYSGVECLEIIKEETPDIILLDLMMPEMDGFETCKRLKSVDSTRDIPVIIVTVREAINDKLKCFSFKADDYIVKPYQFDDLLARIYLHLNRSIDAREREQKQRTIALREVLRKLSEEIGRRYEEMERVLISVEKKLDNAANEKLRVLNDQIIRIVELTREMEDPYYDSPYIDLSSLTADDDDASQLESVPSPSRNDSS